MIELEIVTPERRLLKVLCESVTLPGAEGEFEVLEGHVPLLASLKTGVLSFKQPQKIEKSDDFSWSSDKDLRLMVADGFAEVDHRHVTVICEGAALPGEVDVKFERTLIDQLHDKMKHLSSEDEKEFKRAEAELERATVKLQIA
jgi:F-type H+-transporting ATPase subunit epsilon